MNTQSFLPLTGAALFSVAMGLAMIASSSPSSADAALAIPAATPIIDLPTVTVRPDPQDLAWFQANRIVDLDAVTVRPDPADRAAYLAANAARIVDMPVVSVRPAPEDLALFAATASAGSQQLAVR